MARSHHRKKHKEHLRQFKHSQETDVSANARGKAVGIFTLIGAALGFAVSYFATQGSILWMSIGVAAGGILGYYIGRKIDEGGSSS